MNDAGNDVTSRRRAVQGWIVVLAICAALIAWGLAHWLLVRDGVRAWDFGVLRDAPGESPASTEIPGAAVPRQIAPLPGAVTNR